MIDRRFDRTGLQLVCLLAWAASSCADPRPGSVAADGPAPAAGGADTGTSSPDASAPAADAPATAAPKDAADTLPDLPDTAVPPGMQRLILTVQGPGRVDVAPINARCETKCQFDVLKGTSLTLSANPGAAPIANAIQFMGWSEACSGTATCPLTMDSDRAATARFHRLIHWEQQALGSPASLGDALFLAGSFSGTQTVARQTVSARGMRDGWLLRCDLDGKPLAAKVLSGPGDDALEGIRRIGSGELLVRGSAGSGDVLYDGKPLGVTGPFVAFLGPDGELRRAFPMPADHSADADGASNLLSIERPGPEVPYSLVKRDTTGRVVWSKPSFGAKAGFFGNPVVDPVGNVVALHIVDEPIFLHRNYLPENGGGLLIKLSPEGQVLWEVQISGNVWSVRFDGAGNIFAALNFIGPLRVGGSAIAMSIDAGQDIGFLKLSGTDGAVQWFRPFGSYLVDWARGLTLDAGDRVVAIGTFSSRAMAGAQEYPSGTLVIRLDPGTGNVIDALDLGRSIGGLLPLPAGDFIYTVLGTPPLWGRLSFP